MMKQQLLYILLALLLSADMASAQFIVEETGFSPTGLSNQGKVAGYLAQSGPWSIWLPDSASTVIIGGTAPGNGPGGQSRFSYDGRYLSGTSLDTNGNTEMSRYDRTTGIWTQLGSLGYPSGTDLSGGYSISGDGTTVVGLSWADTTGGRLYAHAVAWTQQHGIYDLGSIYDSIGRSTRANAVSYDGSVVVGWQDFNGPWKSAVWRKNPAGGYFPNQFLVKDTTVSPYVDSNQLGECTAISKDGKWIGGNGDYNNNNNPWIWSRDSGLINLGTLPNLGTGYVGGMSENASIVVGWFDPQPINFGNPTVPYIWTRSLGMMELDSFVINVLRDSISPHQINAATCISPDGKYIAGYGVNNATLGSFAFRLSLPGSFTGLPEITANTDIKVYPNPVTALMTIETAGKTTLTISSMDGRVLDQTEMSDKQIMDISKYASGVYFLTFRTGDQVQIKKVIKN